MRRSYLFVVAASLLLLTMMSCNRTGGAYLARGNSLFQNGKYEDASLNYRKAIQKDATLGEAHYRLGLSEWKLGRPVPAFQSLYRAAELMPDNAEVKIKLANISLAIYVADTRRPQFHYDLLRKTSDWLLTKDPNSYDGLRIKGQLALTDGRTGEAIEALTRANRTYAMQPVVIVPLVEALFQEKRFSEAEVFASALLNKEPGSPQGYQLLYACYTRQNRNGEAAGVLQHQVQNNPRSMDAILQLALHYHRQKQMSQVIATLDQILKDPQAFPQGLLRVGEFYSSVQDQGSALRFFELGAKTHPEETIYLKKLVGLKIEQGKQEEALGLLEELLRKTPNEIASRTVRAGLLLESANPEYQKRALAEFQMLAKEKAGDAALRFKLSQAHLLQHNRDQAKKELEEAVRLQPDHIPALLSLAGICLQDENYQAALQYTQKVLVLQERNPSARFLRSVAWMGAGSIEEARAELTRLQREYPESTDVQLQLGLLLLRDKRFAEAERVFQKLFRSGTSDSRALEGLTQAYSVQSQYEKALKLLSQEAAKSPNPRSVKSLLARTALAAGKIDLAVEQYRSLVETTPSGQLYAQLGEAYERKYDLQSAMKCYLKARELNPQDGKITAAIANLKTLTGHWTEALADYHRALELAPSDPNILNNTAFLTIEIGGNFDEALSLIERARKHRPNDPEILDTLGWAYIKKNLTASALKVLTKLVEQYPAQPAYRYHLAVALQQSGDVARAKAELHTALTQAPAKDLERKIRDLIQTLG